MNVREMLIVRGRLGSNKGKRSCVARSTAVTARATGRRVYEEVKRRRWQN